MRRIFRTTKKTLKRIDPILDRRHPTVKNAISTEFAHRGSMFAEYLAKLNRLSAGMRKKRIASHLKQLPDKISALNVRIKKAHNSMWSNAPKYEHQPYSKHQDVRKFVSLVGQREELIARDRFFKLTKLNGSKLGETWELWIANKGKYKVVEVLIKEKKAKS